MPAKSVCKPPDQIDFWTGAAMMLKGLTVQYLLRQTQPQWRAAAGRLRALPRRGRRRRADRLPVAKAMGLKLIGTAGSDEKCQLALEHGAAYAINYQKERLRRARQADHRRAEPQGGLRLGGQGHLRALARLPAPLRAGRQLRQCLGQGAADRHGLLAAKGSLYRDAADAVHAHRRRARPRRRWPTICSRWWAAVRVKIRIDQRYALKDAAQAHPRPEARKTTGCSVLLP